MPVHTHFPAQHNKDLMAPASCWLDHTFSILTKFFMQKAFWGEFSFKGELQDSSFAEKRIKFSPCSESLSAATKHVSNSLAALLLDSLGNFPGKGTLQKPSLTLSLSARHSGSAFQVSTYIFKNLHLQITEKLSNFIIWRVNLTHSQERFSHKLCLIFSVKTWRKLVQRSTD